MKSEIRNSSCPVKCCFAERHFRSAIAFSLIELLVVITIIVVLLALLTPALDKAIYQAELAVCSAQLKAIGTGVQTYAFDHQRRYPNRAGIDSDALVFAWRPNTIQDPGSGDDRPRLREFLSLNKNLNDPLNEDVDLEDSDDDSIVESDYDLFFGFKYINHAGMFKVGDKLGWFDGQTRYRFGVLALDSNIRLIGTKAECTHPDADGVLVSTAFQDEPNQPLPGLTLTTSRWEISGVHTHGFVDRNFAYDDGGVSRVTRTSPEDEERMVPVPIFAESNDAVNQQNFLPRN